MSLLYDIHKSITSLHYVGHFDPAKVSPCNLCHQKVSLQKNFSVLLFSLYWIYDQI